MRYRCHGDREYRDRLDLRIRQFKANVRSTQYRLLISMVIDKRIVEYCLEYLECCAEWIQCLWRHHWLTNYKG
jgi:hypothetical protein